MASDNHTDKNAVFRKLRAKSDNKVCLVFNFLEIFSFIRNFDCKYWDLIQICTFFVWICFLFICRCVSIAMRRILLGRRWRTGSSCVLIALLFTEASAFTSASLGIFYLNENSANFVLLLIRWFFRIKSGDF